MKTALALALPLVLASGFAGCFWLALGGAGAEGGCIAAQKDRSAGQTV